MAQEIYHGATELLKNHHHHHHNLIVNVQSFINNIIFITENIEDQFSLSAEFVVSL